MIKIVQRNEAVLRGIALAVPLDQIKSKKIKSIVQNMRTALDGEPDGIAIAAPQIGEPYRIFVISKRILELNEDGSEKSDIEQPVLKGIADEVYINPVITKISREKKEMEEGCLSVRYLYGKVSRSVKATIKAYDENGKAFVKGGSGLRAQVFQHETDHLNGILFSDKAIELREMPPESRNKLTG